jgi:hypothetical protein
VTTAASDLPGVSIEFLDPICEFTLAEAQAGIEIDYRIHITEAVSGITPDWQDSGRCVQQGDSGFILFETLSGGAENYCLCQSGHCAGFRDENITLVPGTYESSFTWSGLNWNGPSDTGNPMGAAFPVGTYTLRVSAIGELSLGDAGPAEDFEVVGTLDIVLVD